MSGKIRVGTIRYENGKQIIPELPGYETITVLMKSSKYGSLGPYCLQTEDGVIFENYWQFSKVYPKVKPRKEMYSIYSKQVVWNWTKTETHITNGEPNEKYYKWRQAGFNNPYHVRYPVGKILKSTCAYAIKPGTVAHLDYVESRKQIYAQEYIRLVKRQKQYKQLAQMLADGKNLLIVEVDGPIAKSLDYYIEQYNVSERFICNNTIRVTEDNMSIMINDTKHAFGHGYCLAMALLDIDPNSL